VLLRTCVTLLEAALQVARRVRNYWSTTQIESASAVIHPHWIPNPLPKDVPCKLSLLNPARWRIKILVVLSLLSLVSSAAAQSTTLITLDQAIALAIAHNHALKAARTLILQNRAQEITANLRPNPVLNFDSQFVPIFSPSDFSSENLNQLQQFDLGVGYLFERGRKRQHRLQAARDATAVTTAQVSDDERTLTFNVAQQFVSVLLAESTLRFALLDLKSFQDTVDISRTQYKAGYISEGDYLKIKLQLLQFQTDVSSARLARVQGLIGLRQLLGYDAVPADYDVVGDLSYQPVHLKLEDLQMQALRDRPDYHAAELGVTAAQSQIALAQANAKQDVNATVNYTHVSGENSASFFANIGMPIFDRNQGEIQRTRYALTQAQESQAATSDAVLSDVSDAYEGLRSNEEVVQIYTSGYLQEAQDSRDISEYAYKRGATSVLEFLDAERSNRAVQLAYRQALASYMTALEQLREAVGTRNLP
jgi:outer membrane protein, heavy metal efflux system